MTDKKILVRAYELLKASQEADMGVSTDQMVKETIHFIEEEWQKEDEIEAKLDKIERKERGQKVKDQELVDQYNRNREVKDHIIDVAEIERHRGLVIGEDGTVKELI